MGDRRAQSSAEAPRGTQIRLPGSVESRRSVQLNRFQARPAPGAFHDRIYWPGRRSRSVEFAIIIVQQTLERKEDIGTLRRLLEVLPAARGD
jgi:hypothetical protein